MIGRFIPFLAVFLLLSLGMMGGAEGKPGPRPQPQPQPQPASWWCNTFCSWWCDQNLRSCDRTDLEYYWSFASTWSVNWYRNCLLCLFSYHISQRILAKIKKESNTKYLLRKINCCHDKINKIRFSASVIIVLMPLLVIFLLFSVV